MKITKKNIGVLLDSCQISYSELIDVLLRIKKGSITSDFHVSFVRFQSKLGRVLFELSSIRRATVQEGKRLVERKSELKSSWFLSRMRILKKYQDSIDVCIGIGRAIGDAFAWPFYELNYDKIVKDYPQAGTSVPPDGLGGKGEIGFVEAFPIFEGCFTLLHNNTSLLKTGDVSFVDINTGQLIAVGEIKSKLQVDGMITINLTIIGNGRFISRIKTSELSLGDEDSRMDNYNADRFKRQLHTMYEFMKPRVEDKDIHTSTCIGSYHFDVLQLSINDAVSDGLSIVKAGHGILYVSFNNEGMFSKRFLSSSLTPKWDQGDTANLIAQAVKNSIYTHNCFAPPRFGQIIYDKNLRYFLQIGCTPIFWYPLEDATVKRMYMQDVLVMTVLNPSFLLTNLSKVGITFVKHPVNGKTILAKSLSDGGFAELQGFSYYLNLLNNYIMKEDELFNIIQNIVDGIIKAASGEKQNRKFEIAFRQVFE